MQLYSTNNPDLRCSLKEAIFQGLPADNGLYMPVEIPELPTAFIRNLSQFTFPEIAVQVARALIGPEIPKADLETIIRNAITFPAPVVNLGEHTHILELFHGPSLAFKDFGARFMAQTMSYFNREAAQELTILVATSGDTGGAVAAGFYQTPGIRVVILYPSGKVSPLQEKQLTTLGHNITALEVAGTFDDCQALVKRAFLDTELRTRLRLSSANSINISRLIPQVFYYWEACKQLYHRAKEIVFVVPSGNFGNLTAGLIAWKMGLPASHFVAATNANDVVPEYLKFGAFIARPSIPTLSNAMDVGNPSNFARMLDLYGSTWNIMKEHISGYAFTDEQTRAAMQQVFQQHAYIMDPHGAVGYLAWKAYQQEKSSRATGVILETAHPSKFREAVESILGSTVEIPDTLARLSARKKEAVQMPVNYIQFREWLINH
ncbi:MAG: threonine synthase [Saprospirales bacterium]|nr:threonine synthase [Saprospirales bacterium]